ncbi:MAG: hypothetical protein ABSB88_26495 [Bryobacteraceae bacterium]
MAFRKIAICLTLAAAAHAAQFPVTYKKHAGVLTVDETGVSYAGAKAQNWSWKYQGIQRLTLSPDHVTVLTYEDSRYFFGADLSYEFTGKIPAVELYDLLKGRLDQRLVAALAETSWPVQYSVPAKHLLRGVFQNRGSQGTLSFGADAIAWSTASTDDSRTWRYRDIATISSSGPFDFTITTLEKTFHFQLKQVLAESQYNELWIEIEKKNGRIQ